MRVASLDTLGADANIDADLVIIGGGPAGLSIAREFFGTTTRVLVLESGMSAELPKLTDLNTVESVGEPRGAAQVRRRIEWHGSGSASWSHESQGYGVRCRVLGGSSHAWAGKVAAFDPIDFAVRDWIPHSGWPLDIESLGPYLDRAADILNLGPNHNDSTLWKMMGLSSPPQGPDQRVLRSFFWQISRSRINGKDAMRFGPEFLTYDAPNVRVLLNATVTRINTNESGSAFESVEVSTIDGVRSRIAAKAAVLAASGIENPRLLLASTTTHPKGLGNAHDLVGRYLMDHAGAKLGHFRKQDAAAVMKRFGFYSIRRGNQACLYMHGLAPSPELQTRERLHNCALYMLEERSLDDPWSAMRRLWERSSTRPVSDLAAIASSPALIAKGIALRLFESDMVPEALKQRIISGVITRFPNFAVREFRTRSLPHKLESVAIEGIAEQRPNPDSRITLSDRKDALGVPMARIDWRDDIEARRSLARLGNHLAREFVRIGLPPPQLEAWVANEVPEEAVVIDSAHTCGTTRMSDDPKRGVVDPNCQVHGIAGLYVAGASTFPTSGHANPTLMILALAVRLADRIKHDLNCRGSVSAVESLKMSEAIQK